MRNVVKSAALAALLCGFHGCSGLTPEEAAAREAGVDSLVSADNGDMPVTAADAGIRVADAPTDAATAAARTPSRRVTADNSDRNSTGDYFLTALSESIVLDDRTVLEKGTTIRGRVVDVESAGRVNGLASIQLVLTDIVQGSGMIPITTAVFAARSDSTQSRDTKVIAGTAAVGTVIGAVTGGRRGAAIGPATGAGAGTGVVLATRGDQIHYGPETRIDFMLTNSVTI